MRPNDEHDDSPGVLGTDTGWCAGLELNGDGGSASSLALRGRDRDGAMACFGVCKQIV